MLMSFCKGDVVCVFTCGQGLHFSLASKMNTDSLSDAAFMSTNEILMNLIICSQTQYNNVPTD